MEDRMPSKPSRPLHVQRVEQAVDLTNFLNEQEQNNVPSTSTEGEHSNEDEAILRPVTVLSGLSC